MNVYSVVVLFEGNLPDEMAPGHTLRVHLRSSSEGIITVEAPRLPATSSQAAVTSIVALVGMALNVPFIASDAFTI